MVVVEVRDALPHIAREQTSGHSVIVEEGAQLMRAWHDPHVLQRLCLDLGNGGVGSPLPFFVIPSFYAVEDVAIRGDA